MKLNEIKHSWRPWLEGQDNGDANIDIPLLEDDTSSPVVQKILKTKDDDFGPPMTLEEALAWARK